MMRPNAPVGVRERAAQTPILGGIDRMGLGEQPDPRRVGFGLQKGANQGVGSYGRAQDQISQRSGGYNIPRRAPAGKWRPPGIWPAFTKRRTILARGDVHARPERARPRKRLSACDR